MTPNARVLSREALVSRALASLRGRADRLPCHPRIRAHRHPTSYISGLINAEIHHDRVKHLIQLNQIHPDKKADDDDRE